MAGVDVANAADPLTIRKAGVTRPSHLPERWVKYVFVGPAIAWILLFSIFPLLYSLRMSLFYVQIGQPDRFNGLNNFLRAFRDYQFWSALRVTVEFVAISVSATVILGLLLALLLNREIRGIRVLRTIFTTPLFATPVAMGYLGITIYSEQNGPANAFLKLLHVPPVPWLSDGNWALVAVALIDIWQWTPFCFLVFLAALQSLPRDLYESAALESNSSWRIFRGITLPLIVPVITTIVLLRIVETFKIVDIPFSLTAGGPGISTRTYSFFDYQTGLRFNDLGYGTALAYLLLILVLVISMFYFWRTREVYD